MLFGMPSVATSFYDSNVLYFIFSVVFRCEAQLQLSLSLRTIFLSSVTNDCGLWSGNETMIHMHTKLENGILHNEQQPGSAAKIFVNQGEFEATKTLNGCRA